MNSVWSKDKTRQIEAKLNTLHEQVDSIHLQEGLAIFISLGFFKMHFLPFPVKEKVMPNKNFEIRDLIYFSQFLRPYYLLAISKKRVRLFRGSGGDLQKISNNDSPKQYTEEYEYARPGIGSPSSAGLKKLYRCIARL